MRSWTHLAAAGCAAVGLAAHAADFDGTGRIMCAPVVVNGCVPGESCEANLPGDVGAPTFVRIDFDQQMVVGPKRNAPIKLMEKTDSQILLMGTELGHGWTIALDRASGDLSATIADRHGAFVVFGSCTPL